MSKLKQIIERADTPLGRGLDVFIQSLIVISLTTVGYGDVYPITVGGRVFTFFVLLIGLGMVSVPPGLVASAMSKARDLEE